MLLSMAVSQLHLAVPSRWVCLIALCKVPVLSQKPRASSFYSNINLVNDTSEVIGNVWVRVQYGHLPGVALAPESTPGAPGWKLC